MKKQILTFLLLCVVTITTLQGQNISNNKFGKGLKILAKDSSFYMKASLRFQTLYNGELNLETDEWKDNVMIRRARLKFNGYVHNPKIRYKVELAISNRDNGKVAAENNQAASIVLDAVLKYKFAPKWEIWFGQTKLPGNRERVISSQALQFVDRSQVNSKYTIDRGTGVQVRGKQSIGNFVLKEAGAISMGEGRNFTASNVGGYELTGRLEMLPFGEFTSKGDYFGSDLKREKSPKLAIGFTYDQNNNTNRDQGFKGKYLADLHNQNTLFLDAMFKYKGISSMFEFASKTASGFDSNTYGPEAVPLRDDPTSTGTVKTGTGTNFSLGYLFKNNFEVAARYTGIKPENNNWSDDYSELTLGFSKYIVGHNLKVQSDLTHINHNIDDDSFRFRFQAELAF